MCYPCSTKKRAIWDAGAYAGGGRICLMSLCCTVQLPRRSCAAAQTGKFTLADFVPCVRVRLFNRQGGWHRAVGVWGFQQVSRQTRVWIGRRALSRVSGVARWVCNCFRRSCTACNLDVGESRPMAERILPQSSRCPVCACGGCRRATAFGYSYSAVGSEINARTHHYNRRLSGRG